MKGRWMGLQSIVDLHKVNWSGPQLLIVDGEPAYLYVATGLSPEEGCGSCSHVFKLNVE